MALTEAQLAPVAAFGSDAEVPAIKSVLEQDNLAEDWRRSKKNIVHPEVDEVKPFSNGHQNDSDASSIPMHDQLAFTPRKLRVITVGAGFSGLMMAHKFQHRFPEMDALIDHTIYEKRHEVGGTWLVNTYPGVQCDVPSHIYVCIELGE